jgi:hypothetical protein
MLARKLNLFERGGDTLSVAPQLPGRVLANGHGDQRHPRPLLAMAVSATPALSERAERARGTGSALRASFIVSFEAWSQRTGVPNLSGPR